MWPPLNTLYPQLARSLLHYRYERRDQAAAQAKSRGWSGLMWPWESAQTGVEAETHGGKIGGCSIYENHINADIAFVCTNFEILSI